MQRESCKTLLTICNFQKKCKRALVKRQSAIANCELRTANSDLVLTVQTVKCNTRNNSKRSEICSNLKIWIILHLL